MRIINNKIIHSCIIRCKATHGLILVPVNGIKTICAMKTESPIAIGALFPAPALGLTAVSVITNTRRKEKIISIKKAPPVDVLSVTTLFTDLETLSSPTVTWKYKDE